MASGERDLTRGSVWRQVLAYAMPLVASSLLQALYSMVDTVIAGHFAGSAAISAINNSGQILNILTKMCIRDSVQPAADVALGIHIAHSLAGAHLSLIHI